MLNYQPCATAFKRAQCAVQPCTFESNDKARKGRMSTSGRIMFEISPEVEQILYNCSSTILVLKTGAENATLPPLLPISVIP